MIRGYVSSDEDDYDDYDDYDFGYSEPLIISNSSFPAQLPEVQSEKFKEKLHSALEKSQQVELFLKAVGDGDLSTLRELIGLDISPDCTDSQGWTPLIKACGAGKPDVVEFLLLQGADPNKHRELFTPLMTCCTYTLISEDLKLRCASILLDHGAQVNAKDKYQTTALMYASGSGYKDIVVRLLEVPKINVNMQDKEGWTALFYAVNQKNMDIINLLTLAGTNINLKDRYSRTVITLALDKGFKAIANALGYVEEVFPDPKPKKQLKDKFLAELPDSNGKGGFKSDAKKILKAFKQFSVKEISLPDLLNATHQDLYNIGVKLKPDREKILKKGIHRYHLYPWSNSSRYEVKIGVPMTMEDAVAITGTLARNLTIINASLRYLDTRISSRKNTHNEQDVFVEKHFLVSLVYAYYMNERIRIFLTRINNRIKQIKPETPADFISLQKEKPKNKFIKLFCYGMAAVSAGFVICNYNSHSPLRIVYSLPFYCSFWFQGISNLISREQKQVTGIF